MSNTDRVHYVVAFTNGAVYAGKLVRPLNTRVMSQVGSGGLQGPDIEFFTMIDPLDGIHKVFAFDGKGQIIVDPVSNLISSYAQEVKNRNTGILPKGCALAAGYGGRALVARPPENGSFWACSAKFDPFDWRYNHLSLSTSARFGGDPTLGEPGDNIVALVVMSDDYALFGCESSWYYLVGDPGFNGQMAVLTKKGGILGPRAHCIDDDGLLWFLGNDGLNVIAGVQSKPRLVSGTQLIGLLDQVDPTITLIQMEFNALRKEVHMYLTPRSGAIGVHIIFDKRSAKIREGKIAPFLDEFAHADHGPWAARAINSDDDQDRQVILGGNDGYLRQHDETALADDGLAIATYCDYPVIEPYRRGFTDGMVKELQGFAGAGSGTITWEWYVGDSPDEVRQLVASPSATGTMFGSNPGLQAPVRLAQRGGAHKLRIKQTSDTQGFAVEKFLARFRKGARRH